MTAAGPERLAVEQRTHGWDPRQTDAGGRRVLGLHVLDALRGLAALYVVLDHATNLLWAGSSNLWFTEQGLPARTEPGYKLALATVFHSSMLFGGQAVLLFFLISGFCIHYRQARLASVSTRGGLARPGFGVRSFAWRRARRLYPPLLVALLITAVCDQLGYALFPDFYAQHTPWALTVWLGVAPSLATFIGSLAFQASLAVPAFGTDVSLWSLAYEFWFYALYPVLLFVLVRRGVASMLGLAMLTSVVAAVSSRLPVPLPGWVLQVLMTWAVWVMGAVIAEIYVGRVRLPRPALAATIGAFGLLACQMGLAYYGSNGRGSPKDLPWGASMALVLAWLMVAPPRWAIAPIERLASGLNGLGRISYSLYVVHLPLIALISAWWLASHSSLPIGLELASVGAGMAVLLGVAAWLMVERHFVAERSVATGRPPGKLVPLTSGERVQ